MVKTIGIAIGAILGFLIVYCLWVYMISLVKEHKEAKTKRKNTIKKQ